MRTEFQYDSCGVGKIQAYQWVAEGPPTAIIQIVHGINDHAERFDQFARYLCSKGYLVVAHDQMGHGKTASLGGTKGYFDGGWDAAVEDICRLISRIRGTYPDLPYILLGQSMGSFLVRTVLCKYPDIGISGAILCGTVWMPDGVVKSGKAAAEMVCRIHEERKPSPMLRKLMFGSYNRRVERVRTSCDWLTRDSVIVDAYVADPMCNFTASGGMIRDMMGGILYNQNPENLSRMKKNLPVLFIAGGDDPVGNYGEGVRISAEAFRNAGMEQVDVKIYPLGRHEMLNEINRAEVFRYINIWIRELFL